VTPVRERVIMALGRKTNAILLPGLPVAENRSTWPDAPPSPVLLDRSTVPSGRSAATWSVACVPSPRVTGVLPL
jgi:hypothetical protein